MSARGAWRLAALLFIAGSLSSLPPALMLLQDGEEWKLGLAALGVASGLLCLSFPASRHSERWLQAIPVVAIAEVVASAILVDFFFSYLLFFVAVYIAVVFPRLWSMAPHLVLLAAGPFVALLGDEETSTDGLRWALSLAPTLVLTSVVIGRLTGSLASSRKTFEQLSGQDGLTGVGNYRALMTRLAEEISRHRRRGREFALLALDLDNFKQVNETEGHLVGDLMLAIVGSLLDLEVRGEDTVYRQGGDEFSVIAPETGTLQASELARRIEVALSSLTAGTVTLSATVVYAIFPRDGQTPAELLDSADANLYTRRRQAAVRGPAH